MSNNKFFTQKETLDFLNRAFGVKGVLSRDNINYSTVCPICKSLKDGSYSKQKLVIRVDNFYVKCWVCGFKARNLIRILKKYKPTYLKEYLDHFFTEENNIGQTLSAEHHHNDTDATESLSELPEGFKMFGVVQGSSNYIKSHRDYLRSRGIVSDEDLWYWKLGLVFKKHSEYQNRIIFPSFDANGNLNYFTARSIIKTKLKRYVNPQVHRENIVFNELNLNYNKEMLIVEGPFDLLKTKKATENATCLLGSELTSNYLLFEKLVMNKTPVIISLDPDKRKNQYEIAERLHEFGNSVKIIDLPNQYEDIGDLTKEQFTDIFQTAITYDEDYILKMRINSLQE